MVDQLYFFAISLAIGLLIGIERERSHREGVQPIGLRSFILFALLGTLAAVLNHHVLTTALCIFVVLVILLGYLRSTQKNKHHSVDIGLTTEISAVVVFGLGFLVPRSPLLASILASLVLLLLIERQRLHVFARKKLRPQEIEASVVLLIFVLGILPFLPNHPVDPWGLINPRFLALLLVVIATMQFAGYVAIRVFGQRSGMALVGFFGGLVSSTAVFVTLPRLYHEQPKILRLAIAAALFSIVGMFVELLIILLFAAPALFYFLLFPVISMLIVGIIIGVFLMRKPTVSDADIMPLKNPLDMLAVLRLTLFIAGVIILVTLAKRYVGAEAAQAVAFLGGLFELHSVTLATALLYNAAKLKLNEAGLILSIAVVASFVSKYFLLWTLARDRFAKWTSVCLAIMLLTGSLTFWIHP